MPHATIAVRGCAVECRGAEDLLSRLLDDGYVFSLTKTGILHVRAPDGGPPPVEIARAIHEHLVDLKALVAYQWRPVALEDIEERALLAWREQLERRSGAPAWQELIR